MMIQRRLTAILTGFALLASAGSARAQESIDSLKSKVLSFQNATSN